jgi:hypothetical protein
MEYFWIIAIVIFVVIMMIETMKALTECWDEDVKITLTTFSIAHPYLFNFWISAISTLLGLMFIYSLVMWVLSLWG